MTREETINYLKSSGMSDEQIRTVVDAFTCEDCISRQAVLDIVRFENRWLLDSGSHNYDTDIAFESIISKVSDLPPVQPKIKTGHWYRQTNDYVDYYECSECGMAMGIYDVKSYCPNCGSKNEVEE